MIPKIGITEDHLQKANNLLSVVLSDEMTLVCQNQKISLECGWRKFYGTA